MRPQAWLDAVLRENPDERPQELAEILWPLVAEIGFARAWLKERLERMAQHPADLPGGYSDPVMQSLVMLDDGRIHLSLAMLSSAAWQARMVGVDGGVPTVDFADGATRVRFLVADDLVVQRHWLVAAEGSVRARSDPPFKVEPGVDLILDNASEALRFRSVGSDVVMIRLLVRDFNARLAVECDARSGAVLRTRQAQSHEGRMRMTVSLLRSLGVGEAIAIIRERMPQWPSHLRWHGVMEALALDSRAGFAMLEGLVQDDPDTGVRDQAAQLRDSLLARHPQLGDGV
jgi:hypothetical protein